MKAPTKNQIHMIRHATGDGSGHRNGFCASEGDADCVALVSMGLFKRHRLNGDGSHRYYHATPEGFDVAHAARLAEGLRWYRVRIVYKGNPDPERKGSRHKAKSHAAARWDALGDCMESVYREDQGAFLRSVNVSVRLDDDGRRQV